MEEVCRLASWWIGLALVVILSLAGLWDLLVTFGIRESWTVSRVIHSWSVSAPVFLLWVGFLLGHLFFPLIVVASGAKN